LDAIVDAVPQLSTVLDLGRSNQPMAREFEFDDTSEDESFIPTPTFGDSTDENVRSDMTDLSDKKSKCMEESKGPYLTPERTPSEVKFHRLLKRLLNRRSSNTSKGTPRHQFGNYRR